MPVRAAGECRQNSGKGRPRRGQRNRSFGVVRSEGDLGSTEIRRGDRTVLLCVGACPRPEPRRTRAEVASAHRTALSVEIVSEQASLAPDGGSMTFDLSTVCDRGWTIVEASVSVTQPQASGTGSFTPNCGRIPYVVRVTVPATSGTFQTGPAEATAVLFVQEGPTKRAQDSATLRVRPDVSVVLADQAVLEGDGRADRGHADLPDERRGTALLHWWKSACGGAIRPSWCSDHEGQLGERVSEAGSERCLGPEIVETPAEVLNERMAGDDDLGGAISLQPSHRPEASLQPSVVGLDGIVSVDLRVMECRGQQLIEDAGVDPVPVGGDLDG